MKVDCGAIRVYSNHPAFLQRQAHIVPDSPHLDIAIYLTGMLGEYYIQMLLYCTNLKLFGELTALACILKRKKWQFFY